MVLGNVERDGNKAFEASHTRVVVIMLLTYTTLYVYFLIIHVPRPELNAIVPAIGFNLSTWSLYPVRMIWLKFVYNVQTDMGTEAQKPEVCESSEIV